MIVAREQSCVAIYVYIYQYLSSYHLFFKIKQNRSDILCSITEVCVNLHNYHVDNKFLYVGVSPSIGLSFLVKLREL